MIPHVSVCREEHSAMLVSAILLADAPASTTAFDITQHVLDIFHFWTTTIAPRIAKESVRISIGQTSFKIKNKNEKCSPSSRNSLNGHVYFHSQTRPCEHSNLTFTHNDYLRNGEHGNGASESSMATYCTICTHVTGFEIRATS